MMNWFVLTLRSQDPGNSPARQAEALGKTINNQNIILVNILNVLSSTDGASRAVIGVIVSGVEFIGDECRTVSTQVLDLGKFWVDNHTTGRVARV